MYDSIIDMLSAEGLDLHGIEITQNGEPVLKRIYDEDIRYPVYSVTKSVTSAAFSLACDDGLLSADTPLSEFLEKRADMPKAFKELTFSRFLTMTAGKYPFRPEGDDWLEFVFSLGTDFTDSGYCYSNIPAYLVGRAVENAVGGDLMKYLDKRLFAPLEIPSPKYAVCPQGHFYGATGMELSVHELTKLGQLYLNGGIFAGERILSEQAVRETVTPRLDTGFGDSYGYFFRIGKDHYSMVGKWGQRCIVYPERKLIVSYLSHQPERSDELYRKIRDQISNHSNHI